MFNPIRIIREITKGILFIIGCLYGGPFELKSEFDFK
jgi:hypothetical protein